jgi:hypothetical protein
VNVKETKRQVKLQQWVLQVRACQQSGLPVRQWCKENGVAVKSYYYHLKRVREELLDVMQAKSTIQMPVSEGSIIPARLDMAVRSGDGVPTNTKAPMFAAFPMPQGRGAAVTVWLGGCSVDIQNGADGAVVEQVLKVVSRL